MQPRRKFRGETEQTERRRGLGQPDIHSSHRLNLNNASGYNLVGLTVISFLLSSLISSYQFSLELLIFVSSPLRLPLFDLGWLDRIPLYIHRSNLLALIEYIYTRGDFYIHTDIRSIASTKIASFLSADAQFSHPAATMHV